MIDFEKLGMLSLEQYRQDILYAGEKSELYWCQAFLNNTDWYVIRYAETNAEVPVEVSAMRETCRNEIERLRNIAE